MTQTNRRAQSRPVPKLGPRMTRQRAAVVETLRGLDKFASAKTIHEQLLDDGASVGLTTVYRTLQSLAEVNAVDVLQSPDGETLYRDCLSGHHHHHLVCRICWTTVEVTAPHVEAWATAVAAEHGFTDADHTVEITGVCARCRAEGRTRAA